MALDLEHASHWLPETAAGQVSDLLVEHLAAHPA